MAAKIAERARPAEPSIDRVLEEFLEEQRARLGPRTLAQYEAVLDLLRRHLDGYAYEGLSRAEAGLFDRHYGAKGEEHREFCQIFGPDKIVENLGSFLGYFMIRKVMAGQDLKRAAGAVTKKLSKWLAARGYLSDEVTQDAVDVAAAAARELPRAERAAQILRDAANRLGIDPAGLAEQDYLDFDHLTISKLEPGRLWLEHREGRQRRSYGPIPVPEPATRCLREGWDLSCSLGRVRGTWRIVEVANVYPA